MRIQFSELPRLARVGIVVAALVVILNGLSFASDVAWRRNHPAPLGRTKAEVDRALSAHLPDGISLDSAASFLAHAGLDPLVARSTKELRSYRESDSLFSGGPVLSIVERNVTSSFMVSESLHVVLYFDASERLVRRKVESWYTGP
jgi:hypothetical protein